MKLHFDYKGTKITYELTYKKTRAISINIDADGKVSVIAPIGTSVFAVMDKIKGNAPWILSELANNAVEIKEIKAPELLEQYTYLGKNYGLEIVKVEETPIKVKMVRGKFVIETNTEDKAEIRNAIVLWYKDKVEAKIKERLKVYKESFDIIPTEIKVADDKQVFFRANDKAIFANVRLGMVTVDVMDYIIVSSLCHINAEDKEAALAKLQELLPSYEKSAQWIEENKNQLSL